MTIEITRTTTVIYRISPDNACLIERRKNKRGERWKLYRLFVRAEDAREGLLRLEERERERGTT